MKKIIATFLFYLPFAVGGGLIGDFSKISYIGFTAGLIISIISALLINLIYRLFDFDKKYLEIMNQCQHAWTPVCLFHHPRYCNCSPKEAVCSKCGQLGGDTK